MLKVLSVKTLLFFLCLLMLIFAFRYYTLQKKHLTEGNQNENEPPRSLGLVLNDFIIGSKNYGTGHNGGWKGTNDNLPNTNNILITTDDTYKEPGATLINPTTGDPLDPTTIDRSTLSKFIIKAPNYKEYRTRTASNINTLKTEIKQLNMTSTPSSIAEINSSTRNDMYMTGPNADGVTDEIKFKIPGVYKIDYLYIDRATNPTADPYIIGTRWITVKSSSSGTPEWNSITASENTNQKGSGKIWPPTPTDTLENIRLSGEIKGDGKMPSNPMLIYVNQEYVEPGIKIETNVQSRLSLYGPTMDRNDIEFSSDGTNWNTPTASQVKMDPAREIRVYTGTTSNGIPLSNFKPGMLNTSSPISTQIRYRFVIFDSDTLTDKTLDLIRYVNVVEKPSITQGILDKLGTLSFLKNAWSSSTSWNVSADATAHDLSGNIKQFYPEPWFNPEKAGQPWQGPTTNTNRDISFNYYYDNEINTTKATVDPSGYILGCTKLVSDAKYKYARIDKRGCFGGQDISNLTQAEIDALPYNRITLDANKFINETQKPSTRGGYKGITCEVVHENRNWICASNCVFQGLTADAGNIAMSDISNAPNEVGWRTVPSSGIVKHNETQTFQCNITNQMYSVLNSERNERRKCMHGEMSAPLGGAAKSLQCSASKRVRGCQPITDTEDARCLNQIKQENGRFFKYCPVVCNPGGLSGNDLCTKDSQCKSHVYKHDINDSVANVPHTNPFESGDNKGYHRIEVDASGNNINKEAQRLSQKMFYSRLITDGDISGGKKEIDLNILEQSTLSGLFNHFKNNMKLKDMAAFFEGIKSYFNTNKMDDTNKWLNDSSNYGLAGSEDNLMMSSKESSDEMNYATGGRHLLSDDLVMNPTEYKNRNQYMAMARQELYNKKRDTDEKILNPTTIPAQDLEKLGKIMHQDKNLRKKLENKYLSEDEHYKVRMQISRLQGEKMSMIKSIKNKEKLYSRTVKEGEGKMAFKQNDQNYIAFANQPKTTYVNTQGQTMQVPQSVGGKF